MGCIYSIKCFPDPEKTKWGIASDWHYHHRLNLLYLLWLLPGPISFRTVVRGGGGGGHPSAPLFVNHQHTEGICSTVCNVDFLCFFLFTIKKVAPQIHITLFLLFLYQQSLKSNLFSSLKDSEWMYRNNWQHSSDLKTLQAPVQVHMFT